MISNFGSYKGVQLLKKETVEWMRLRPTGIKAGDSEPNRAGKEYPSNALFLWEKNLMSGYEWVYGHDGGDVGIATEAWMNESSGVGVVVLMNADWNQKDSKDLVAALSRIEVRLMAAFDKTHAAVD